MKWSCEVKDFFDIPGDAVVLFCIKGTQPSGDVLEKIDIVTEGAVTEMYKSGEFDGSSDSEIMLRRVPETAAARVILAGLGDKAQVGADAYRRAAGRISTLSRRHKIKSIVFYYDGPDVGSTTTTIIEGFILGGYRFLDYKSDDKARKDEVQAAAIAVPNRGKLAQAQGGVERGEVVGWAVTVCRDLVGTPGNDLFPDSFARQAQKLARDNGVECKVLGPVEIKKEKMGALEAVGKGSERKPRFVILKYNGKPGARPVVLVGKGITFDSGGISLKPALDMGEMKGDMTGAGVVQMAVLAAARLKCKVNLIGLIPLAENMPSGIASRPGDIIRSRAGLTIEIISTDAEGRLILADALDYADQFKPQAVIDIATLTGAALYILGYAGAPFVGTSQILNDGLRAASLRTGEKIWELPLWDEFADQMKSPIADLKNGGGKPAGTLAAASFLKKFTKEWPWAHIDIAYCDNEPAGRPYVPKGPTGFGVRLLVDLISHWKKL